MEDHHLILGRVTDYITGETLVDTHDCQVQRWFPDNQTSVNTGPGKTGGALPGAPGRNYQRPGCF